jgi:hypothetical protein
MPGNPVILWSAAATTSAYTFLTTNSTSVTNPYTFTVNPWVNWVPTMPAAAYYQAVWAQAVNDVVVSYAQVGIGAPAIISEETRARMQAEQREYDERMRAATAERQERERAARARAKALLFRSLTRDQQQSLEGRGYFDMNVGGKTYRIHRGTHGNVRLVQAGQETMLYCAQPNNVPVEDAMLAQKLMLETDEQAFLRVANARVLARAPAEALEGFRLAA